MARGKKKEAPAVAIDQEYELVAIGGDTDTLKEHPQNPRRGDEAMIEESIRENGWYGAVTAQKSTGYILAGNHRYRVAVREGATEIPVIWKDVDDEIALRILLVDNRSADAGDYDEDQLQAVLDGLESLRGTGYAQGVDSAIEEAETAERTAEGGSDDVELGEVPNDVYTPSFGVMVVCDDEEHQAAVYEYLKKGDPLLAPDGFTLRVVAV